MKYRYKPKTAKTVGIACLILYAQLTLFYSLLPVKPYPLFPWTLYGAGGPTTRFYDIVVHAVSPEHKLDRPVFLATLDEQYQNDWDLAPFKAIRRLGREIDKGNATPAQIELSRRLVENFMQKYNYVEYQLVRVRVSSYKLMQSGQYGLPEQVQYDVLRNFVKDTKHEQR